MADRRGGKQTRGRGFTPVAMQGAPTDRREQALDRTLSTRPAPPGPRQARPRGPSDRPRPALLPQQPHRAVGAVGGHVVLVLAVVPPQRVNRVRRGARPQQREPRALVADAALGQAGDRLSRQGPSAWGGVRLGAKGRGECGRGTGRASWRGPRKRRKGRQRRGGAASNGAERAGRGATGAGCGSGAGVRRSRAQPLDPPPRPAPPGRCAARSSSPPQTSTTACRRRRRRSLRARGRSAARAPPGRRPCP